MNDKEFREMSMYDKSLHEYNNKKYKQYKVKKNEEEPKTPIWWAITIFCIVYGIQIVYENILRNGGL